MSHSIKINATLLTIVGSALSTAVVVIWLAASKASAIDAANNDVSALRVDVEDLRKRRDEHGQMLSRLDERTIQILKLLETRLK